MIYMIKYRQTGDFGYKKIYIDDIITYTTQK